MMEYNIDEIISTFGETEKEELIRLREENEFLRMSLEYEKKLSTLIQEKERRAKKRRK